MNNWSAEMWRSLIDASPEGVLVCEAKPELPIVYVNEAFAAMAGHTAKSLIGKNPRVLQGSDREQEGRQRLREAIAQGATGRVLIRNYRADGHAFWNEVVIQPVRDGEGRITHWIGFHRDASERLRGSDKAVPGLPGWMREDRTTGLHSRAYVEELLRRDFLSAQRGSHEIALMLFDIDDLGAYNETFDRSAGDACIRRVSRVIGASYRRGNDLVGRWDGGTFAVITQGDNKEKAAQYAKVIGQRVRELLIHHPRAPGRYVTISGGVAALVPPRGMIVETLQSAAKTAMDRAKRTGKNAIAVADAGDLSA